MSADVTVGTLMFSIARRWGFSNIAGPALIRLLFGFVLFQLASARRWMRANIDEKIHEPLPVIGDGHKPGGSIMDVSLQRHMQDSFGHYHGAMLRLEEIRRQRQASM